MQVKHFFASANSGIGFLDRFCNLNAGSDDQFTYVIKGGSGTGKSSLMKKIGEYFAEKGEKVEFIHCSTDTNSLDGIRLASHNICMVDGTAPHVQEAKIPEVEDRIINVGEFISPNVSKYKEQIKDILKEKAKLFAYAYLYLESANKIAKINKKLCENQNYDLVESKARSILTKICSAKIGRKATERKLFSGAVCENGIFTFDDINQFCSVFVIKGNLCFCDAVLNEIKKGLLDNGIDITTFSNVVLPEMLDGIYIPSLDILIKSQVKNAGELEKFNDKQIDTLVKKAGECIAKSKLLHEKLEKCYIENVDFAKLNLLCDKLILDIENRIKC